MEYGKGTVVKHIRTGAVVGECKIKYEGKWVDGVIYEGNDRFTGVPMTFVRRKEEFENEFTVIG